MLDSPLGQYMSYEASIASRGGSPIDVALVYEHRMFEYDRPVTDLEDVKDLLTGYLAEIGRSKERVETRTRNQKLDYIASLRDQLRDAENSLGSPADPDPFLVDFPDD